MSDDDSGAVKVLVSNIPPDIDRDDLIMHLENTRNDGGEIVEEDMEFDELNRTAVVVFKNNEVAERLLAKENVQLSGHTVCITRSTSRVTHSSSDGSSDDDEPEDHDRSSQSIDCSTISHDTCFSVFIENVPEEMCDFLEIFIEKQAGGTVTAFEPDERNNGILVTFEEAEAADTLLAAGHIKFCNSTLKVVAPPSLQPPMDDIASRKVCVSGISRLMSTDVLKMYLESKKANGGVVEEIWHESGQETAVVMFRDIEVAERLIEIGKATYKKVVLNISQLPAETRGQQIEEEDTIEEEVINTVQVSRIPKALLAKDTLWMFFENNRKSGGEKITSLELNDKNASARITFEDPQVAQSLLEKGSVIYKDNEMRITKLESKSVPDSSDNINPESTRTVEIIGIPTDVSEEYLNMFLENKRKSGGGTIEKLQYNSSMPGKAIVTFEDEMVAERLLKQSRLKFRDTIDLQVVRPQTTSTKHVERARYSDKASSLNIAMPEPKTIEVSGLSKDISKEQLELYFESKRRSGGGAVDDVTVRGQTAFVTFNNPDDAKNVASQKHELLKVKLHVSLLQTWPEAVSCAVLVKGIGSNTLKETAVLFFESERRTGGGLLEDFFKDEERGTVVITYYSRETAKNVADKKQLTLEGCQLTVELIKPGHPPPLFVDMDGVGVAEDCLLYVDLPKCLQVDSLKKFLSEAGGVSVCGITFSTKSGVALVKYTDAPDYHRVLLTLCSKPYQGRMLSVQRLPMTRTIQIHNIGNLTEENIELFFESSRNDGGEISHSKYFPAEGYALLEFKDVEVMNRVLRRKHVVNGQEVNISPYFPSLGILPPGFDSSTPFQALPPNVTLDCIPEVCHFIQQSKPLKEQIHSKLKPTHCFVQWPRNRTEKLILKCQVPSNHPQAYALIRGWSEKCTNIMQTYLDKVILLKEHVLKEIWKPLQGKFNSLIKPPTKDEMLMHWDEAGGIVYMCGLRSHVEESNAQLKKIKQELELDLEKTKRQITETFELKSYQMALLKCLDLASQFGGQAKITLSDKSVMIVGPAGEVTEIKLKILEKTNTIVGSNARKRSQRFTRFLEKPTIKEHLVEGLARKNLQATWLFQEDNMTIYGFQQRNVDAAIEWIESEVTEQRIDQNSISFTNSKKWSDLEASIPKTFRLSEVFVDSTAIVIMSVKDQCQGVFAEVSKFVSENVLIEEFVNLRRGVAEVIKEYGEQRVEKIQSDLEQYKVKIHVEAAGRVGYRLNATAGGIERAKDLMQKLLSKVKCKEFPVKENSLEKFLKDPLSRQAVRSSASKHFVVANFSDEEKQSNPLDSFTSIEPRVFSHADVGNGKVVQLMVGDIIRCKADVIVNPANSQLRNGAGVAGAISKAGGSDIDQECLDYIKKNPELCPGQVFVSGAGRMSFKKVVHTVGPTWKGGVHNEDRELGLAVEAALKKSDDMRFSTVALPAISCGIFGYPIERAGTVIMKSILNILKASKAIKVVRFVTGEDKIRPFHDVLSRMATVVSNDSYGPSEESYGTFRDKKSDSESESSTEEDDNTDRRRSGGTSTGSSSFRTEEGINIAVIKGSIAAQKTDIIFCSSDKDLALSKGAVSKSILEAAGPGLSSECASKYSKGIDYGEVVKTGAHKLNCQVVYHGVCPRWDSVGGRTEKTLRKLVKSSLQMASNDNRTSIAFPSIGTGNLKIPHDVVAKAMLDEAVLFSAASGSRTSLQNISIVLYRGDQPTIDAFEKEVAQRNSGRSLQPRESYRTPNSGTARRLMPPHTDQSAGSPKLECCVGEVKLVVKFGDITKESCDAIVNSTNEKLDITIGALSKAIVQAGGDSIVEECKRLGKLTDGMAVTSAGRIPCKKIFHLYAKPSTKAWKDVIGRCFAEAEKLQLTSLVMPPLGTGYTKACSAAEIAEAIFEELSDFSQKNPKFLQQITIIMQRQGMLNEFIAATEKAEKLEGRAVLKIFTKVKEKIQDFFSLPAQAERDSHGGRPRHMKKDTSGHKPFSRGSGSTTLVIYLHSFSDSDIEKAINDMQKICEAAKTSRTLNADSVMNCLSSLPKEQEARLKQVEGVWDVKINIDKRTGIKIQGHKDSVSSACEAIYQVLFEQKDKEMENREHELFAKQAVWKYDSNGNQTAYSKLGTGVLEKAYQDKKKKAEWTDESGVKHKVSLIDWHDEHNNGTKSKVIRIVPGQIRLPHRWDPMQPTDTVKLVQLAPTSEEYKTVETNLKSTGTVNSIVKIERIQNPSLYKLYMTCKMEMDKRNGNTNNEKRMWHGTAGANVPKINEKNFNRIYGGAHGLSIGHGVYFATQSSYSISGYSTADANGLKCIYQARVLSGKIGQGQSGIKEPPAGFDSVGNTTMVVVFYDAQAYPEYLITFR